MRKINFDFYKHLGISEKLQQYSKMLPHLNRWQVCMAEDKYTANVQLFYTFLNSMNTKIVNFSIPVNLPCNFNDTVLPQNKSRCEQWYDLFLKHKPAIDIVVGCSVGTIFFQKPSVFNSESYLYFFTLVMSTIYYAPSLVREASRLFYKHPLNWINYIASLLIDNKENMARKEVNRLISNNNYIFLRSKVIAYSPYDPSFLFKYYYVNAYVAYILKQYDTSADFFCSAFRLACSEDECFAIHRDYINMLGARMLVSHPSTAPFFEEKIKQTLQTLPQGSVWKMEYSLTKEKLISVLQKLIGQQGQEAAVELESMNWGKFYENIYPSLAAFYYSLKKCLYLCNEHIGYYKDLDIESAFRKAYECKILSQIFTQKCQEISNDKNGVLTCINGING